MSFISILFLVTCAYSQKYNKENGTEVFEFFTMKYNKQYKNETERQRGLDNFINNINKVYSLNEKSSDNATLFVVNMYADMDLDDVQERYALSLKPYINARDPKEANLLRNNKGIDIENTTLYDLTRTDALYRDFMTKYKKPIAKKKRDREARYYRFLKTLIEINRNNFEGKNVMTLDANADAVKAPQDYFY